MKVIAPHDPKPHYQCFICLRKLGFGYDKTARWFHVTKKVVYDWFKRHRVNAIRPCRMPKPEALKWKRVRPFIDWESRYRKIPRRQFARFLRMRVWEMIRYGHTGKRRKAEELIGCSRDSFMQHISKQFREGMSWENYGDKWELDHIIPVHAFNIFDSEERLKCFHYTNFQPLTSHENAVKAFKLPGELKGKRGKSQGEHNTVIQVGSLTQ